MGFLDDVFDECRQELQITPRVRTPKPRKKRSKPKAAAPRRGRLGFAALFAGLRRPHARRDLELLPALVEDVVEEAHW